MQPELLLLAEIAKIGLLSLLAFLLIKIVRQLKGLSVHVCATAAPSHLLPPEEPPVLRNNFDAQEEESAFAVMIAAVYEEIGLPPEELQVIAIKEIIA